MIFNTNLIEAAKIIGVSRYYINLFVDSGLLIPQEVIGCNIILVSSAQVFSLKEKLGKTMLYLNLDKKSAMKKLMNESKSIKR